MTWRCAMNAGILDTVACCNRRWDPAYRERYALRPSFRLPSVLVLERPRTADLSPAVRFVISCLYLSLFALSTAPLPLHAATSKVQTKRIVPVDEAPQPAEGGIPLEATQEEATQEDESAPDAARSPAHPPEVLRDFSALPEPVRQTREKLLEAALSGDIERLRPLIGSGDEAANLAFGGVEGDPIAFLKEASGDEEGHEILAILAEILESGFVRMDAGTEHETYVWPYFFAWPYDKLTPPQRVELFRILTAGDLEDSQSFGGYIFYRLGIKPDGRWSFFLAGD